MSAALLLLLAVAVAVYMWSGRKLAATAPSERASSSEPTTPADGTSGPG